MKKRFVLALALAAALPAATFAQQKDQPAGSPAADPMMEAYIKLSQPGDNHKILASLAGEWKTETKAWMGPGEPMASTGKARSTMMLGGRYLHQEYEGTFLGMQFAGYGDTGYDNITKKFVSTWVDTMSTGILKIEGTYDQATKSITMTGDYVDPSGAKKLFKEVLRIVDADKHVLEMYDQMDGKEVKVMEINYTRVK